MDGQKSFLMKQTADPGLLFCPFRMDGWVFEIISFKLLTKGRDIRSASNVVGNIILIEHFKNITIKHYVAVYWATHSNSSKKRFQIEKMQWYGNSGFPGCNIWMRVFYFFVYLKSSNKICFHIIYVQIII